MIKLCIICGHTFEQNSPSQICCSKICSKTRYKIKRQEYNKNNANAIKIMLKNSYETNYFEIRKKQSEYSKLNRDKINLKRKQTRAENVSFKLANSLRSRINSAIKNQSTGKAYKTVDLLGCSVEESKIYLESKFQEGMTWENHGQFGWHIDHIVPCASFDLTNPEEQKKCFHYTNLQPLWWRDNIIKSSKGEL